MKPPGNRSIFARLSSFDVTAVTQVVQAYVRWKGAESSTPHARQTHLRFHDS